MRRRIATGIVVLVMVVTTGVALASDDPDFDAHQYGPQQIHAPEAWTVSRGEGVTIAIVDSGVQLDHPDLRDKIVPGYDFADDDDEASDEIGHGTHVAGIAAAVTDNGIGIAGVAPESKIMPIRVPLFQSAGTATVAHQLLGLRQGIQYAVDNGAKVINLSLGEDDPIEPRGFDELSQSCAEAFARGALCVAAAGNSGKGKPSGYAHDFQGIVVAANDRRGEITDFSQRADTKWSVSAPGHAVHSTWIDSGYRNAQGTSMSAPHVSGVAALLFAQGLTVQQVVDRIMTTATPLNDGGGTSGAGLVNAAAAVGADFTPTTTTTRPAATSTTVAGGGPPVAGPTTTLTTLPEGVELVEGEIEEGDLVSGETSEFGVAIGGDTGPEPINAAEGFTADFLVMVAAFVGVLVLLGIAARRLVLRRGIGQMKTEVSAPADA